MQKIYHSASSDQYKGYMENTHFNQNSIFIKNHFMSTIPSEFQITNLLNQDTYLVNGELKKWEGETLVQKKKKRAR